MRRVEHVQNAEKERNRVHAADRRAGPAEKRRKAGQVAVCNEFGGSVILLPQPLQNIFRKWNIAETGCRNA